MVTKLKSPPTPMEDEGPFSTVEAAERRQEWLEMTWEMGYRVCSWEGPFYCVPSLSLPNDGE